LRQAHLPARQQLFARWNRPIFAAPPRETSGKPALIRARLLLKRAWLFILPANAATDHHGPGQRAEYGGSPGCSP